MVVVVAIYQAMPLAVTLKAGDAPWSLTGAMIAPRYPFPSCQA